MDRQHERVVVTGLGLIGPCGVGIEENWSSVLAGRSGIGPITLFDASTFSSRIAGEVKGWDPLRWLDKRKVKEIGRFTEFALVATRMAIEDSGLDLTDEDREEAACVVGVGMGGLGPLERLVDTLRSKGPSRISPYAIPQIISNMASGHVSMMFDLRGPSICTTSACASGAHAIGEAAWMLRTRRARVAVCGGAESTITPSAIGGFGAMFALSRRNDAPQLASRPFDKGRDGFVPSEGAGIVVLETLSRARARSARIYAEISGYGCSCDAHHPVQPAPDGRGARVAMTRALHDARLEPSAIDYINAHGTSTPLGDIQECVAIRHLFGDHARPGNGLWVSSTKSTTGHLLGAAGAFEAAFCALSCARGEVPPTSNIVEQDPACDVDVVPNEARRRPVRHALSNSFGFGGTNASLVLSAI